MKKSDKKYLVKYTKFVKSIDYYKSVLPKKYKNYFNIVTKLYLDRKIEKQSEVHKLLAKLSGRGKGPSTAIKLINDKYIHQEPIVGLKTKNEDYFITMEIDRTITYKNQRNKNYDVKDKVTQSIKVKAKNENQAKQKANSMVDTSSTGEVDSVEEVATKINNVKYVSVVNESSLKPVEPAIQWLEASSDIVKYNFVDLCPFRFFQIFCLTHN